MTETCKEITTTKGQFGNVPSTCGCPVKFNLKYTTSTNNKDKNICGKHLRALKTWLDRIKAEYTITELNKK